MIPKAVNQDWTPPPPAISTHFQNMIDQKVAGVALPCFEALIHWILTTCSCFYPAYNRFYEHQRSIASANIETIISEDQQTNPHILQNTTLSAPPQQSPPFLLDEHENSSTSSEESSQSSESMSFPKSPSITMSSIGLATIGNILQDLFKMPLYHLVEDFIQLPVSSEKNATSDFYENIISVKLSSATIFSIIQILEELILPIPCAPISLRSLFQDELTKRLEGDPFDGNEPLKEAAQNKLHELLVSRFEEIPTQVLVGGWHDTCPRKFQEHSFRSAAALEVIAKRANQGSLFNLIKTLECIQTEYLQYFSEERDFLVFIHSEHSTKATLLETKSIRAMQLELINRLDGLNPYNADPIQRETAQSKLNILLTSESMQPRCFASTGETP